MLSKMISDNRRTIYNTKNLLSSVDEGNNLIKLITSFKPMKSITTKIKEKITMFWINECRISLDNKNLCNTCFGRSQ